MNDDEELRRECVGRLDEIADLIPAPWSIDEFLENLAERRQRRIILKSFRPDPDAPCGIYMATDDADHLVYPKTYPYHRDHVLGHEIAHMIMDSDQADASHPGARKPAGAGSTVDPAYARLLFPDVPPHLIKALLGRHGYSTRRERRAELFAELLLQRVRDRQAAAAARTLTAAQQEIAARLSRALEHPHGRNMHG
ncbi:hypothetical protein [Micromonospora sp. CPCC 206061]|uniref:hypothetical protein n=1 Tax=Micromonospora sp. CPCC 206061 TaxID=3122410 RepID=UPI002FEE8B45